MPASNHDCSNIFLADGSFELSQALTELRLADGRTFCIPTALLSKSVINPPLAEGSDDIDSAMIISIVEESLDVSKRTVATGKVRLEKMVQAYDVTFDESLAVSTWNVERVPMNLPVDVTPEVRQEGNTTIYPLLEERLILTKQLILKEELPVTRQDSERRDNQVVTLRREHVSVEREALR